MLPIKRRYVSQFVFNLVTFRSMKPSQLNDPQNLTASISKTLSEKRESFSRITRNVLKKMCAVAKGR